MLKSRLCNAIIVRIPANSGDTLLVFFDKDCGRCLPSINEREVFDPKDLYDPDSSGETFCVLKEKEEREYGE